MRTYLSPHILEQCCSFLCLLPVVMRVSSRRHSCSSSQRYDNLYATISVGPSHHTTPLGHRKDWCARIAGASSVAPATVVALCIASVGADLVSLAVALFLSYNGCNSASHAIRMLPAVAFWSFWTNNTPIVAVMIPVIEKWSVRADIPVSHLLMPMSFSVILGGALGRGAGFASFVPYCMFSAQVL
jgi:hypothetical protein